jgi:membrane associated rhomboid family serine protease
MVPHLNFIHNQRQMVVLWVLMVVIEEESPNIETIVCMIFSDNNGKSSQA